MSVPSDENHPALAKVTRRLVPILIVLYVFNYLDRTNIAIAKLDMNPRLGFTDRIYSLAAGIFFIGYFLFEIPSNLILQRTGARIWISRIMISWGLISASMMFIRTPLSFYTLRFLLGLAEAGFFPGILLYLTSWFPARRRARVAAAFLTSTAISCAVGNPLSGLLLRLDGKAGMAGWQWMFLLEGLPSALLGLGVWWFLTERPREASWLSPEERAWLEETLRREEEERLRHGQTRLGHGLTGGRVWHLCLIYFLIIGAFYNFVFWLPTIIKERTPYKVTWEVGLVSSIPYLVTAIGMVLVGLNSDRTGERRWHVVVCCLVASASLIACYWMPSGWMTVAALSVAGIGIWGTLGPFWSLPPNFLTGTAAAAGIALINSIGNLSGYAGQEIFGRLKAHGYGTTTALFVPAGTLLLGAALMACLRVPDMPSGGDAAARA